MLETEQVYSVEERAAIARGMALLGSFEAGRGKAKTLKRTASTLRRPARIKHDVRTGHLVGEAEAVVHASVMDVVAYLMQLDSRHYVSTSDPAVDLRFEVLATVNEHHVVLFMEKRPGKPVRDRTFLSSVVCMRLSEEPLSYAVASVPIEHHPRISHADERHSIRAEAMRSYRLTALGPATTLLEYACWLDLKGHVPKWVTQTISIPAQMGVPYRQQQYSFCKYWRRPAAWQSTASTSATCCSTRPSRLRSAGGWLPSTGSWHERRC